MKKTIAMIDTVKGAIPIEKLLSYNNNLTPLSAASKPSLSTRDISSIHDDGTFTVAKGYSNKTMLYSGVKTTISTVQAANFGFKTGTYYITCEAINALVAYDDSEWEFTPFIDDNDMVGIDPNDLSKRGYYFEKMPRQRYNLTTYLWGLTSNASTPTMPDWWIPMNPNDKQTLYPTVTQLAKQLQWRFFSE